MTAALAGSFPGTHPADLPFREAVEVRFSGSGEETCLLHLKAGLYIEISVEEPPGTDVTLFLRTPDNRLLHKIDTLPIRDDHSEVLAMVTPSGGTYRLTVKGWADRRGRYQVLWKTARPASPTDRLRAEAHAAFSKGEALRQEGSECEAHEQYQRALRLWTRLGDRNWPAQALFRIGRLHWEQGQNTEAIKAWEAVLPVWRGTSNEPELLNLMGLLLFSSGEFQRALEVYREALTLHPDPSPGRANVIANLAELLMELGDYDEALKLCRTALEIFEKEGLDEKMLIPLRTLGMIYSELGDEHKALEALQRGEALAHTLGRPKERARLLNALGNVHIAAGRYEEARRVHLEALQLAEGINDQEAIAHACGNLGYLTDQAGNPRKALRLFDRAVDIYWGKGQRLNQAQALSGKALALWHLDRFAEAQATLEELIRIIESLRAKPESGDLRTSFFASRQRGYEGYLELLMDRHRYQPEAGFNLLAFEAAELMRARSLLEDLEKIRPKSVTPELFSRIQQSDRALVQALAGETAPRGDEADPQTGGAGGRSPLPTLVRPLSVSELQRRLGDEQTLILAYKLGPKTSYLWLIGQEIAESHELPGRDVIEREVRETRSLLAQSSKRALQVKSVRQARQTADLLLKPIAEKLGDKRLVIIPDGELHSFPFGVLPDPAYRDKPAEDPRRWWPVALIEHHEIVYEPSASVLALIREQAISRQPASKVLALLAPETGETTSASSPGEGTLATLPPLPYSREEAEAISQWVPADRRTLAIGAAANLRLARNPVLGRHEILHFAGHALVDPADLAGSGLVLVGADSMGRPRRELLGIEEIHELDLPVDLVVLSACSTGLGAEVPGEGLVGLTRGFLYAGSSRVVTSLWDIRDQATADLMKGFYEAMLGEQLPTAAALRKAQIAMLRSRDRQAPYYWGGFVLHGEWH